MDLAKAIQRCLSASSCTSDAKCFPVIWVNDSSYHKQKGEMAADAALRYYWAHGFAGDRSRMNQHGYAARLRDLQAPPPWVTVEMEDCEGDISDERRIQLRPFVQQVQGSSDEAILSRFRDYQKEKWDTVQAVLERHFLYPRQGEESLFREKIIADEEALFRQTIILARLLGVDVASSLYDAVFDEYDGIYEDILVSAGAPDLLVWLPNKNTGFWFLSEVKAPGDYLSKNQRAWLNQNWNVVRGHYLVTQLE
jgi:hypothetical protein